MSLWLSLMGCRFGLRFMSLWLRLALGASALLLSAIERRRERWILSMSGLALVFVSRFLSARVLVTLNAFAPGTACKKVFMENPLFEL